MSSEASEPKVLIVDPEMIRFIRKAVGRVAGESLDSYASVRIACDGRVYDLVAQEQKLTEQEKRKNRFKEIVWKRPEDKSLEEIAFECEYMQENFEIKERYARASAVLGVLWSAVREVAGPPDGVVERIRKAYDSGISKLDSGKTTGKVAAIVNAIKDQMKQEIDLHVADILVKNMILARNAAAEEYYDAMLRFESLD